MSPATQTTIPISDPSVKSLLIEQRFGDQSLGTGTAFVVNSQKGCLLITNRHIVTGRHQETNNPLSSTGGVPDKLVVTHNGARLGEWVIKTEPLYSAEGRALWIEHPALGSRADFVALPLTEQDGVQHYPYNLENLGPNISVAPAEPVSVVGFPFGLQVAGSMAIWATGFIASEPGFDYINLPVFLIDCRGRQGQSGSPVIAQRNGGAFTTINGNTRVRVGASTRFLGIYSGRVNTESDLGFVWKASAIKELVDSYQ